MGGGPTARSARGSAGHASRIRFAETQPIPTYLFAFAAGKFQVEPPSGTAALSHVPSRNRRDEGGAQPRRHLRPARPALTWLEDYTAIPYQFGKFDFVLIPSFQFSGMEHAGAIFYNASDAPR